MLVKFAHLEADPSLKQAVEQAFWGLVHKTDGCWFWCGELDRYGYGKFEHTLHKRMTMVILAHRLAYFLQHQKDPGELLVCHTCDNKRCVRGDHFFLGTHLDNMKDYSKKYQARKAEK